MFGPRSGRSRPRRVSIVIEDEALRQVRSALLLFALVCSSTAAHLVGGGGLDLRAVLALALLSVLPARWLGRRPRSRTTVTAVLAAGQAGWHYGLAIAHGAAAATTGSGGASVHAHHGFSGSLSVASSPGHGLAFDGGSGPGWAMACAHLCAAVLVAQAVHLFDALAQFLVRALRAMVRLAWLAVVAWLARVAGSVLTAGTPSLAAAARHWHPRVSAGDSPTHRPLWRGPPAVLASDLT